MAASEAKPALKKMLWLKRLKGALDDDDSSDSASQLSEATPTKVAREKKPDPGGGCLKKRRREEESGPADKRSQSEGRRRHSAKSPKRAGKSRRASAESSSSEDAVEIRLGRAARRKRSRREAADGSKTAKSPVGSAKAKASREQRKQKLRALRHDTGEDARLTAFKFKRQQSYEGFKEKERVWMRAIRARGVSGTDADVEDEVDPKPRPSLLGKGGISGEHKPVASKKIRENEMLLTAASSAANPDPAERGGEDIANSAVITKNAQVGTAKPTDNEDESIKCSAVTNEQLELVANKEGRVEMSNVESGASVEPLTVKPDDNDEKDEKTNGVTTGSGNNVESVIHECNEERQATPVAAVNTSEYKEVRIGSYVIASNTISESMELEQGQAVCSTKSLTDPSEAQTGDEEKKCAVKNEQVLLDATPIPRKTAKSESATVANASAFVIPKRSFAKPESQTDPDRGQVNMGDIKRSLQPRVPVVLKPLLSPESSPQLSKLASIRPQRKRKKNPVPVKHVAISKQDRVMMRLSKRRNSIFMATAELAVRSSDVRDSTKAPAPRMIGYEVFDVNGKVLPDLISRLNCATKHEIESNRDSYAASFFGVSLSAPKSKEKANPESDVYISDKAKTREINCYEKLRFERPRDREFYQQRMYGTTFVPQSLRGWITVIIRNARFERRSTGIRFNQDRDREEFAASLVQRYKINKSVPRCDIPRENWQRLMKNQPGTVYLHYYNREDAKQASQVFRDDFGNPLELKTEYKAGVVISPSSSPAADVRFQNTPRRSCSSERSAPRPSPLSSQNGSARSTPLRQRDRLLALKSGNRSSRYDRGPPPAASPWSRDGGRFGPSLSGNKRPRRSRSRSRSRTKPLLDEYDPAAQNSRASSTSVESNTHLQKPKDEMVPHNHEGTDARSKSGDGTPAEQRAASLSPLRPSNSCQERGIHEKGAHNDQRGKSVGENKPEAVRAHPGENDNRRRARHTRSPPRGRWAQQPNRMENRERRDDSLDNARGQSRGHVTEYCQGQEQVNRPQNNMRRSRSRQRREISPFSGGRDAPYIKERRQSQDFMSNEAKARGERVQSNSTNRYGGRDYRNRGSNDRRGGGAYTQP